MVNYFGPENLVAEKMTGSDDKVVQKLDEVISALMEANHFTNLSVQPTLSFTSNIARRYRPGGRAISFYQREAFIIQCEGLDEATGEKEYTMLWKRK